ncbi:Protein DDI1 -like protein 2 [Trichinella pseudospiralis]|uniref:Protein DDI1-like protein 2 n=1 Tax=Trichinella pseudospiralis TaxID=6337 RepID=A0A0V1ESQ1_TRIPS|nr:Protein DDI1 -like protein 2 [Trichinella pseudospiralis]KRZ32274.1 Protein DDI1 -like protein 2 [Trichinella pseudospiralis]KRZ45230.1 Protein DDI1 -like protein 2 [Trichinella pseudospiralis]
MCIQITLVINQQDIVNVRGKLNWTIKEFLRETKGFVPRLDDSLYTITIMFNGELVSDFERTIKDYGIKDADVLAVNVEPIAQSLGGDSLTSSAAPFDPAIAVAWLSRMMNENPQMLQRIRTESPAIFQALQSGNVEEFQRLMQSFGLPNFIPSSANDLMNAETQRRIEDSIMQQNIDHTLQHAIEHVPESFARVVMLFIKCKVNGQEVKAFVDSGAESSVMSVKFAEKCNILRLADKRFRGVAKGVGTCAVVGRIHMAQLQIGNDFFPISLMVVEDDLVDMMLGLDMLKRHQCIIDLRQNCLVIGTTGVNAPFLMEHELPAGLMEMKRDLFEGSMQKSEAASSSLPSSSTSSSSSSATKLPDEEDIAKVMEFGFSREEAIKALKMRNNVKQAVAYLVAQNVNKHFPEK